MGRLGLLDQQIPIAFGMEPVRVSRQVSSHPYDEPQRRRHPMLSVLALLVLLAAAALLGAVGWQLRTSLWQSLPELRSEQHLRSGFAQGMTILREAKLATGAPADAPGPVPWIELPRGLESYYAQVPADADERAQRLDTPPLRMAIMAGWVNYLRARDPAIVAFASEHTRSLLSFASAMEAAAALLAGFIVVCWVRRQSRRRAEHQPVRADALRGWPKAVLLGVIAAALVWLNPAVLLNGHVAPAFDSWLIPAVLTVVLLASLNAWLLAGAAAMLSCLVQGHAIYFAPLLLLWPLAAGRFGEALRALTGFVAMAALLASPWLVPTTRAWIWIGAMVAFATAIAPWIYPRRLGLLWWIATVFTLCVLIAPVAFDSPWPWTRAAEHVVSDRAAEMQRGPASNLPALLSLTYGWSANDALARVTVPRLGTALITMEILMIMLVAAVVLLCGIGASLHARRRDPHVLAAIVAPWLAIFLLLPGMHERWLIWAAAISAIGIAASSGLLLLHLLISGVATLMILHRLLLEQPQFMPATLRTLEGTHPGLAWAMLLCLAVLLYLALTPRPRIARASS